MEADALLLFRDKTAKLGKHDLTIRLDIQCPLE